MYVAVKEFHFGNTTYMPGDKIENPTQRMIDVGNVKIDTSGAKAPVEAPVVETTEVIQEEILIEDSSDVETSSDDEADETDEADESLADPEEEIDLPKDDDSVKTEESDSKD